MTHVTATFATTAFATGPLAGPLAGPESDKAGPLGLLVILLLGVATVLLVRSMNGHLRKVPPSFDRSSLDRSGQADKPGDPDRIGRDEPAGPDQPPR